MFIILIHFAGMLLAKTIVNRGSLGLIHFLLDVVVRRYLD